jgi:Glyoxalase-like domain
MTTSVLGLSIDCSDALALAGFWSQVLGRPVNPGADAENAAIAPPPAGTSRSWRSSPCGRTASGADRRLSRRFWALR